MGSLEVDKPSKMWRGSVGAHGADCHQIQLSYKEKETVVEEDTGDAQDFGVNLIENHK